MSSPRLLSIPECNRHVPKQAASSLLPALLHRGWMPCAAGPVSGYAPCVSGRDERPSQHSEPLGRGTELYTTQPSAQLHYHPHPHPPFLKIPTIKGKGGMVYRDGEDRLQPQGKGLFPRGWQGHAGNCTPLPLPLPLPAVLYHTCCVVEMHSLTV